MKPLYRRYARALRKAYSLRNRRDFLRNCIDEMVTPRSTPKQLLQFDHPFPSPVQTYLTECSNLLSIQSSQAFEEARKLGSQLRSIMSNTRAEILRADIASFNFQQKERLARQLSSLCANSRWKSMGRPDIITNISSRPLSDVETEVLSLGLKFATGIPKPSQNIDLITKNYRYKDSDFQQGYIQGLLTSALCDTPNPTLPKRYLRALEALAKDPAIRITTADKGGGVVVMDAISYQQKMTDLLSDGNTYAEVTQAKVDIETQNFLKAARRILRRSETGKCLLHLLPNLPRPATLYGLPKTHKPNIPMRPITSGIGSAPHKLAGALAKHLSRLLGTISGAHLKHSGDLLNRIRDIPARNKKLASLDVTSLFTRVPTLKVIHLLRAKISSANLDLPLPHNDFVDLVELCVQFNFFKFQDHFFHQRFGMAMGSPLSAVLANLFMEFLEAGPFADIVPVNVVWLRYVDDILLIAPRRLDIPRLQAALNEVEPSIQFTLEEEINESIPFLDTLIMKHGNLLKFKVYRKPTNKDDLTHFLSHHDLRIKKGVVLGFYLRAFRIYCPEFLEEEFVHIKEVFQK